MNTIFKKITDLFAQFHIHPVSYKRTGISPARDWFVIGITAIVASGVIALCASYVYFKINSGTLFSAPSQTASKPVMTINTDLLNTIVASIHARQDALTAASLKNPTPDPSN